MLSLRTVDLFAGGGGLSLGFEKAGFKIVSAFDHWKPAVDLYRKNINTHPIHQADLSQLDIIEQIGFYKPDVESIYTVQEQLVLFEQRSCYGSG